MGLIRLELVSGLGLVVDIRRCSVSADRPMVTLIVKKVKASNTRYRALGLELMPVYRQSADR